jgi:hypothetical protein
MKSLPAFIFIILLIITASMIPGTPARSLEGTEYQIKAAMMVNFIQFIDWPDDPGRSGDLMTIGIIGADNFGPTLDAIEGRIVNGKQLKIRRFKSIQEISQCQILFVPESETSRINEIISSLRGTPVLTIGEAERFTQLGGIIRFYIEEKHVRFEINQTAAIQSKLKISAKLMEIAKIIN